MAHIETIFALAAKQHGIFSTSQLLAQGIPRGSANHLLKNRLFKKVSRGVYRTKSCPVTWHTHALGAVLSCGGKALLSHESALINLGLLPFTYKSYRCGVHIPIHITLPRISSRRTSQSVHRTIYRHPFSAQCVINAIPQVSIEVAIIESAIHLPPHYLSSVIDDAVRKRFTSGHRIRSALDSVVPAPGRSKKKVEELVAFYLDDSDAHKNVESPLEVRTLRLLMQLYHGEISPQYVIRTAGKSYRLDFAIKEKMIAVEVDGFAFHRSRDQFDDDRERQNHLVLAGWTVIRITASMSDEDIRDIFRSLL